MPEDKEPPVPKPLPETSDFPDPGLDEIRQLLREAYKDDPLEAHRYACRLVMKYAQESSFDSAESLAQEALDVYLISH